MSLYLGLYDRTVDVGSVVLNADSEGYLHRVSNPKAKVLEYRPRYTNLGRFLPFNANGNEVVCDEVVIAYNNPSHSFECICVSVRVRTMVFIS